MTTLLDKFDKQHAEKLEEAFNSLNLPIPNKGEFYNRASTIVFLAPLAITLRIQTREAMPLLRHAHLLRPLGSLIVDDKYRIDIQQGGKTVQSEQTARAVHKKLKDDGIYTDDIEFHPNNSLLLKAVNVEFPEGIAVAYDPYKLKRRSISIREFDTTVCDSNVIDLMPAPNEAPDVQDEVYGDLRAQFQTSVNTSTGKIRNTKLAQFYTSCKQYKAMGFISSPWERSAPMFSFIGKKSRKYAERLSNTDPAYNTLG